MADDSPYERVTDAERFAVLHRVADELVADLSQRYRVSVQPVPPDGEDLKVGASAAVRLEPANGGAPVTLTKTDFPGLFVRFGADHTEAFPHCGCDACDEQVPDLVDDLRNKLEAVAAGRFTEVPGGHDFVFADGSSVGGRPSEVATHGPTRAYGPWPAAT